MFGSNNKKKEASISKPKPKTSSIIPTSTSHALNSLVHGTVVEGTVKSISDIRVDGVIKGKLFCDSKVIIGPTGVVEGEVTCKNAVIEGKLHGNLEVAELLNVRESAEISGDISTGKLIIQSGAVFNVSCIMGDHKPSTRKNGSSKFSSRKNASSINVEKEVQQVVEETAKPAAGA